MQEDELWNLINPGMDETIKREDVISFIKTLTTFAVTINKSKKQKIVLLPSLTDLLSPFFAL